MNDLVSEHGFSWPRNRENLRQLKKEIGKKKGVYVLAHGGMPMYVGKGQIVKRITSHARPGSSKSQYWDSFSWFVIEGGLDGEVEVILLRSLPFYVRSLNRQIGSLRKKNRKRPKSKDGPEWVKFPRLIRRREKKK